MLDPAVYNYCRGHILEINEIINDTGAIINIPKSRAIELLDNTVEMKIINNLFDEFIIKKMGGTINWINGLLII